MMKAPPLSVLGRGLARCGGATDAGRPSPLPRRSSDKYLSLAQLIALKPKMDMILCEILYCRWRQLGEEGISCAALDGR